MPKLALPDLRRLLESSAGRVESVNWDDETILTATFDDIGYDSLAVLELGARVQQEYGVRITDDAVAEMTTPAAALDYINGRLAD